ncbi:MAG TPA: cupredoxin domain-containing protein [Thermoplasmata archaeon]|nr:cupredoxin domain-containing protein [Thermoplasmata archaeon]
MSSGNGIGVRIVATSLAIVLVFGWAIAGASLGSGPSERSSAFTVALSPAPLSSVEFLNLTATEAVSFTPSELDVTPGASVHLRILQGADFNHSFILSSVANFTLPTTDSQSQLLAYFSSNPPLVANLSLGSTPGTYHWANFTAPPAGSYEFLCLMPTHFQSGMHGTLVSSSGGSTSSNSGIDPVLLYALIGVIVLVVVVAVAVIVIRRRKPQRPSP